MKKTLLILFAGMLTNYLQPADIQAQNTVRYVSEAGTGDGTSWQNASNDLQAMIDASQTGDEVWVASGTYKPERLIKESKKRSKAFFLKNGVSLYGGFKGTETSKEERTLKTDGKPYEWQNQTILSGDDDTPDVWTREIDPGSSHRYVWRVEGNEGNSNHVLYSEEKLSDRTVIDGFTIKGAYADVWQAYAGGAAVMASGHIEIYKCRIEENMSYNKVEGKTFQGGAVYLYDTDGKAIIESCLFERNQNRASYESANGGALYGDGVTVLNSEFSGCVSFDNAGAVYNKNGLIEGCLFENCYAGSGGAIVNEGTVKSCSIFDCRALKGGAIYNSGAIEHCIAANCYADTQDFGDDMGGSGGGIYMTDGTVLGSLVYNCSAFEGGGIYVKYGKVVNSTIQHCTTRKSSDQYNVRTEPESETCVFNSICNPDADNSNFKTPTGFTGTAKSSSDSLFVRTTCWQLTSNSEFIDTGTLTDGIKEEYDLAGNPRINGTSIDVGAYEYTPSELIPDIVLKFAETSDEVEIGTGGNEESTFKVDWGDGKTEEHQGAKYVKGKPVNGIVKIYGDELLVLQVTKQGLVALDISNASELGRLQVGYNQLSELDVTANTSLTGLYCEENKLESLDISHNKNLRVLDCHNNTIGGTLDCTSMTKLTKLDCANNKIETLSLPSTEALTEIDCGANRLTKLNLSGLPALGELNCNDNQLTELDLSANTLLYDLYCPDNNIATMNLSANAELEKLSANGNELKTIDLSANTKLTGLYLQNNALEHIDLSANTAISWMNLEHNRLDNIDLTPLKQLSLLNVAHNELKSIDLSNSLNINTLHAGNNNLTEINTSGMKSLIWLTCDSNNIDRLDLSDNQYLSWLECEKNCLTELDVTKQENLQKLFAGNNSLTNLDLSANTKLQGVRLEYNLMESEILNSIMKSLPNVSDVEIHDNNAEWARKLDISMMPGTGSADKALAEQKGWIVNAIIDIAVNNTEKTETQWWYDIAKKSICHKTNVYDICIYNTDGTVVKRVACGSEINVEALPEGMYIATGRNELGEKLTCRFIR